MLGLNNLNEISMKTKFFNYLIKNIFFSLTWPSSALTVCDGNKNKKKEAKKQKKDHFVAEAFATTALHRS